MTLQGNQAMDLLLHLSMTWRTGMTAQLTFFFRNKIPCTIKDDPCYQKRRNDYQGVDVSGKGFEKMPNATNEITNKIPPAIS
ncbi:MAG: hypothetical protein U5L72_03335 [Bacteroidales bacterium]|nr:hypothetical protein [Bacteroidales bacterium]